MDESISAENPRVLRMRLVIELVIQVALKHELAVGAAGWSISVEYSDKPKSVVSQAIASAPRYAR